MSLSDLVEQQALARPEAVAVAWPDGIAPGTALTYRELSSAANRLAAHLSARGVGAGDRVVTCLPPGPDLVTAFLAIVRTGAAYVPLDPGHPARRRRLIVRDCAARAVVTVTAFAADFTESAGPYEEDTWAPHPAPAGMPSAPTLVALDTEAPRIAARPDALPPVTPAPDDAAYVCYTSGTTGVPKGVVVPHRAVLDLVRSADHLRLESWDVVAQTSNPAFDAVTFEVWATLAAGGRLVGADRDTVLDPRRLEGWLRVHGVTVMFLTTALLHRLADERPAALGPLRAVLFGGEVCDPLKVRRVWEAGPPERLLHMYGPTEATTFATWYEVREAPEEGATDVPIGRPLGATTAVVVDEAGRPVGPGGTGELLLGGPGLALGYLGQPRLTTERFVEDRVTGGGLLYRTGDRVRLREDGDLVFVGRTDDQVKLRGFRVELGEIETVLRGHPSVSAAVASVQRTPDGGRRLVAHVVPAAPAARAPRPAVQMTEWQEIHDTLHDATGRPGPADDFAGWHSSYDDRPVPVEHIRELVTATAERVRELGPRRILEIGAGAGLLLAELAPDEECVEYWATDVSEAAVAALESRVRADARLRDKVRPVCRAAHDTEGLPPGRFDAVVVNSVIQYFPCLGHLRAVVERLLPLLAPGGSLFLGDVRNLELSRCLQTGVALARATKEDPGAVRRAVARQVELETELLLAPALFAGLARELPPVRAVDVRVKRGGHGNELNRYRYEAVLSTAEPVADLADAPRVRWGAEITDVASLQAYVYDRRPAVLRITGVPNARVHGEWAAMHELDDPAGGVAKAAALLGEACPAPGPEELCAAAESLGFRALPTWSPEAPQALDLVLLAPDAVPPGPLTSVYAAPFRAPERCANTPNAFDRTVGFEAALRTRLRERLPDHMLPAALVTLDTLPLTSAGKVDRAALPACSFTSARPGMPPGTPVQEILRDLFAEVLGVPRRVVHADSDFFRLGGHSLSVARLLKRIRGVFGAAPGSRALYDAPTPALLADLVGDPPAAATGPVGSATDRAELPLRLRGVLDTEVLEAALADLGRRHEALRNARLGAAGTRLRTLSAQDHVLELAVPAADVDQWSQLPLAADLARAYEARAAGDTPRWPAPSHDEVPRARRGEVSPTPLPSTQTPLASTQTRLPNTPAVPPSTPTVPPATPAGSLTARVGASLHQRLARFAAEHDATLFMVVHTALVVLLQRLGAGARTTVAAPVPARGSDPLRRSVGPLGRVLALTVDGSGDPAFTGLLARAKAAALAAYRDGAAPLAGPGGVSLTVLQHAADVYDAAGLSVQPEPARLPCACSELSLTLVERQDRAGRPAGITVTAVFRADGAGETVAASLTRQLVAVLESALQDAVSPVSGLRLTAAGARETDHGWAGQALWLPRATVAGLFAERVGRDPGQPALAGLDRAGLDSRSDLLAHVLVEHRAGPGTAVATAISSPTAFAVAALAVAKAGAALLPLDPAHGLPEGVRPVVLLLDEAADRQLPAVPGAVRLVRDPAAGTPAAGGRWPVRDSDRVRPLSRTDPLVLAPCGDGLVVVGAESVVAESVVAESVTARSADRRRAAWLVRGYPDADAALGLLGALVSGRHVVVPPVSLLASGAPALLRWLREQRAPLVLGGGADRELVALARAEDWVLTKSGGTMEGRLVVEHGPGARTRPVPGHRVYVLDEAMRPVPPGATGALYIGGAGVAQGYAGLPGATGERFVPDPLGAPSGTARMWRTGRSARLEADGELRVLDGPWAGDPYTDARATFLVVRDERGHSALWPASAAVPAGWLATHAEGLYEVCVDHLNTAPEGR
ncbi:amino acid adenylation domain-containing protein [Streptomyces sp. NPDC004542]|uniref:amino acid adenylation domain-containing protein n=1 Tax=Streptomyces sp. NPDC004542 TaxID=3154281 RepID=UPI0033A76159